MLFFLNPLYFLNLLNLKNTCAHFKIVALAYSSRMDQVGIPMQSGD